MSIPPRSVPLTYEELAASLRSGAFPREHSWIDFKRRLYPEGGASDGAAREKVSRELAKEMAAMAVAGGYLVYGVGENKADHTFEADDMQLPVGLHETVDAVARNRITPALSVVPSPVPNPALPGAGMLVVEIPASPDAPHMVDSTYWGRSETGNVRLTDDQVERLMRARERQSERLAKAMEDTVRVDPVPEARRERGCHFHFTAVPATGWTEMFADYTRDHAARSRLIQRCTGLQNEISATEPNRGPIAFAGITEDRRSQQIAAGWITTWRARHAMDAAAQLASMTTGRSAT